MNASSSFLYCQTSYDFCLGSVVINLGVILFQCMECYKISPTLTFKSVCGFLA